VPARTARRSMSWPICNVCTWSHHQTNWSKSELNYGRSCDAQTDDIYLLGHKKNTCSNCCQSCSQFTRVQFPSNRALVLSLSLCHTYDQVRARVAANTSYYATSRKGYVDTNHFLTCQRSLQFGCEREWERKGRESHKRPSRIVPSRRDTEAWRICVQTKEYTTPTPSE
jgi:hypothetical protein